MVPKYILVGARRWLDLLPSSSANSAMAIFMSRSEYADLTSSNYRESYEWLERKSLLPSTVDDVPAAGVEAFLAALEDDSLTWLQDGVAGIPSPEFLPEPVAAAADQLGLDPTIAWQVALELGRKVDLDRRNQVGLLGELAIVAHLEGLGIQTDHVSLRSDALGWDVRATGEGLEGHLEVKTTTSLGRLRVYLSRNEYEVSRRDPCWSLAIALIDDAGRLLRVAHVDAEVIQELVPTDSGPLGRWQSCSMDLTGNQVSPGLPGPLSAVGSPSVLAPSLEPAWWPQGSCGVAGQTSTPLLAFGPVALDSSRGRVHR